MTRHLDWRVEALVPLLNPTVHRQVVDEVMMANLNDTANAWRLGPTGEYTRASVATRRADYLAGRVESVAMDAHAYFMSHASLSGRGHAADPDWNPQPSKLRQGRMND